MSQEKAPDFRERLLIVQLKEHFDQERFQGPSVSTKDPAGRVAKALGIGKLVVKEIVSNYHQTGKIAPPELENALGISQKKALGCKNPREKGPV